MAYSKSVALALYKCFFNFQLRPDKVGLALTYKVTYF